MEPYGSARVSRQRRLIAEAVREMSHAFTVDDLEAHLRESGHSVGTATVYRAVGAMEDSGFVERVGVSDGSAAFAHCGTQGHHHHMICTECGHVLPAPCPLDDELRTAAAGDGFSVTGHVLTLYGTCAACTPSPTGAD